jgi:hypothetical protein
MVNHREKHKSRTGMAGQAADANAETHNQEHNT